MGAAPYAVELFHGGLHQIRSVGEDARLEVPTVAAFHADARAGEVGRTDVCRLTVENEYLKMNPRTKHPFQVGTQNRVAVEVVAEIRPRFLGMDEPYLDPAFEQLSEKPQKRRGGTSHLDVQVFDVCRTDPQRPFDRRHLGKHLVVVRYVGNEFCSHDVKVRKI